MSNQPFFGPTFVAELGDLLSCVPVFFSYDSGPYPAGTVIFAKDTTDAQKAAVAAIVKAHDPTKGVVPTEVTNYQARAALIDAGKFAAVDAAVRGQGVDPKVLAAWDYGNTFLRSSPFVAAMASILGMASADVDALFVKAASYTT